MERIFLPLKDGMLTHDNDTIVAGCVKLSHVDLVGGVHEAVAALLLEESKNDMKKLMLSIRFFQTNILLLMVWPGL